MLRPFVAAVAAAVLMLASLPAQAVPAPYVVFELGPNGGGQPVFYARVELADADLLVHTRRWTIQVGDDRLFADTFQ